MEIIKQGTKHKFYDFKCKFCGCIFRIDENEAQSFNIFDDCPYPYIHDAMHCPYCNRYLDYNYRNIYKED